MPVSDYRKEAFRPSKNDEMRRQKEQMEVQLRRSVRSELLNKRRMETAALSLERPNDALTYDSLTSALNLLHSDSRIDILNGATRIRELLSRPTDPPIDSIILSGCLDHLVRLLEHSDEEISYQLAWAFTNIAYGTTEQTLALVNSGAIEALSVHLSSKNSDLVEQVVWALGNVAGDNPNFRDRVLRAGILPLLPGIVESAYAKESFLSNVFWTITNLCRGKKPCAPIEAVETILPIIGETIRRAASGDKACPEASKDALWALAYIADGPDAHVECVLQCKLLAEVVKIVAQRSKSLLCGALRVIGNLVTNDDAVTQHVLDHNVLPLFLPILGTRNTDALFEVCWTVSNVTAGTADQVCAVVRAGLVPSLIECVSMRSLYVAREACWAICNATQHYKECGSEVIEPLVEAGCIKALCGMLQRRDEKLLIPILNSLDDILSYGAVVASRENGIRNPYLECLYECDGDSVVYQLQTMASNAVYKRAKRFLEKFFDAV